MWAIMKGGDFYNSVPRVTHAALVTWISLKYGVKVSLKVRERLLFIGYSRFWFPVGPSCIFF